MHDSYERFFSQGYISKEQFFKFGLCETIYAEQNAAQKGWEALERDALM